MTNKKAAKLAAEAHSNLNAYGAIIAMCEGGIFYAGRENPAHRIIAICKQAIAKELTIFDKNIGVIKDSP